jgi:Leucine-rich repeat (LRR) protein
LSDKNKTFSFSGSASQKEDATVIRFNIDLILGFIPLQIFTEFTNLNGIIIWDAALEILWKGLFTKEFKAIQYLDLTDNYIRKIEEEAFINLPELKWIRFFLNKIESIKTNFFKNNIKLEFIDFYNNKIKMINPSFFKTLDKLIEVDLLFNSCVDSKFKKSDSSLSTMNEKLKVCFDNCLNDYECSSNFAGVTTTTTTTEQTSIETTFPSKKCGCTENFTQLLIKINKMNVCGNNVVGANQLNCSYGNDSGFIHWPKFKFCRISNQIFQLADKNKTFSFSGSARQKDETTVVWFSSSPSFEFIPLQIFTEFPNLNGIIIWYSHITTLKEGFFTKEFKVIKYLYLYNSQIQQIEEEALINLPELKWIGFSDSHIKTIKTNFFKNNIKLEFISFIANKIKMMNPLFFENLNKLIIVNLRSNFCVNKEFRKSDLSLSTMNEELKFCFKNCLNDDECSSNVDEGTTKTTTTTTTEPTMTDITFFDEECGCTENLNRLEIKIEKIINILIAMNPKLKI